MYYLIQHKISKVIIIPLEGYGYSLEGMKNYMLANNLSQNDYDLFGSMRNAYVNLDWSVQL